MGFRYMTPLLFFSTLILIRWLLLCFQEATKNSWRNEEKRPSYISNFNFISGFNNHSVGEKFFLKPTEMLMSPRKGVKIYKSSLVIDKSKLVLFIMLVSACRLSSSRHNQHSKPQDLANRHATLLAAEWGKSPFNPRGTAKVKSNFSFSRRRFFFRASVALTSCQGLLWNSALLDLFFFFFFFQWLQVFMFNSE